MVGTIDEVVLAALQAKDRNQNKLLEYLREYKHGIGQEAKTTSVVD
jgi:hypothetical protein